MKRDPGRLLKLLRVSKNVTRNGGDIGVNEPKGNDPMSDGDPGVSGRTAPKGQSNDYFAAPLASSSSGHLLFVCGASNVTIHADPSMEDLYRARFEAQVPIVRVKGGKVSIVYARFPRFGQRDFWLERPAEVALNATITWHIEVRGSLSRLTTDLREVRLGSINLGGGATNLTFDEKHLGAIGGDVNLQSPDYDDDANRYDFEVTGGANNLTIDAR